MNLRNLAIWGAIVLVLIAIYSVMATGAREGGAASKITYSQLLSRVDAGDIKTVKVQGQAIEAHDRQGHTLTATGPTDTTDLQRRLEAQRTAAARVHEREPLRMQRLTPKALQQCVQARGLARERAAPAAIERIAD